jgi:hypothetical protein
LNPFRINYRKTEDKVTNLFVHVLDHCKLVPGLLQSVPWKGSNSFSLNQRFSSGLQLHNDFTLPVREAYLLGISNTGGVINNGLPADEKEGHPDAYFYDAVNQILVLIEVKVGVGELYKAQLDSHKLKVKQVPKDSWNQAEITWQTIKMLLKEKLDGILMNSELPSYIINNFIGVLNEEVLGEKFDADYLIWLAGTHGNLVRNLLTCLFENYGNYFVTLPKKNHNEVRFHIGNERVATFILNQSRFILHPGGATDLQWRQQIYNDYGVIYDQGVMYPNEFSLPLSDIDPITLEFIPKKETYLETELLNMRLLMKRTFMENRRLQRYM